MLSLLFLLIALGSWESWRHARHRRRIPVRIHVNGSRGKSSVARLIAAGLKAGGMAVVGKTTGSSAAVINTDGTETPIVRRGTPNIKEQLSVFRRATRQGCEALVIECMAIRPDLQRVCEHGIVHATHGVITNVRPDHLDVMGPTLDDVAANLAGTVPRKSRFFTAEDQYADYFAHRSKRAKSTFSLTRSADVSDREMQGFSYVEFPENVGLALDVCRDVGVERDVALTGMWGVTPDTGAMTIRRFRRTTSDGQPREVEFINGFAANDSESYLRVWRRLGLVDHPERAVMLVNLRSDRQRRSKDLAPLVGTRLKAAHYVLVGESTGLFEGMLKKNGIPGAVIHDFSGLEAPELWERLSGLGPDGARIIGVGNIAGIGLRLLAHLDTEEVAS